MFLRVTGKAKTDFARLAGVNPAQFNLFVNRGCDLTPDNFKRVECALNEAEKLLKKWHKVRYDN